MAGLAQVGPDASCVAIYLPAPYMHLFMPTWSSTLALVLGQHKHTLERQQGSAIMPAAVGKHQSSWQPCF